MIKPFSWEYPCVIFSKDEEILEAPFPIICGISRELYLKTEKAGVNQPDRVVFDLDKGEVVLPKPLQYLQAPRKKSRSSVSEEQSEMLRNIQSQVDTCAVHTLWYINHKIKVSELKGLHQELFNSASSHLLLLDNESLRLSVNLTPGDEMLGEDKSGEMTSNYFKRWQDLWSDQILNVLQDLKHSGSQISAEVLTGKVIARAFWMRDYISNFSKTQIFQCFLTRFTSRNGLESSTKSNKISHASQEDQIRTPNEK